MLSHARQAGSGFDVATDRGGGAVFAWVQGEAGDRKIVAGYFNNDTRADLFLYNPANGTWSLTAAMSTPRNPSVVSPTLIGRKTQLAALTDLMTQASAGRNRIARHERSDL